MSLEFFGLEFQFFRHEFLSECTKKEPDLGKYYQSLIALAFVAKEIRGFWGNVEKVFEFRLKTQIEAKRKRALDQHLNKIVEKTEKYSNLLTESMAKGGGRYGQGLLFNFHFVYGLYL